MTRPSSQSGAFWGLPPNREDPAFDGRSTGSLSLRTNLAQAPNGVDVAAANRPMSEGNNGRDMPGREDDDSDRKVEYENEGEHDGWATPGSGELAYLHRSLGAGGRAVHMRVKRPPLTDASTRIWLSPRQETICRWSGPAEGYGDDRFALDDSASGGRCW